MRVSLHNSKNTFLRGASPPARGLVHYRNNSRGPDCLSLVLMRQQDMGKDVRAHQPWGQSSDSPPCGFRSSVKLFNV